MNHSRAASAIADTVLFIVLFTLAVLAAVMPAIVVVVGLPTILAHRCLSRSWTTTDGTSLDARHRRLQLQSSPTR